MQENMVSGVQECASSNVLTIHASLALPTFAEGDHVHPQRMPVAADGHSTRGELCWLGLTGG